MPSPMSVSVVTPSYNQADFIRENLDCIRRQTHPDVEHVVVDGGSDDGTVEILQEYEDSYDLRWNSEPDDGQSDAINTGFERATGEVVGWLNSDDLYFRTTTLANVVDVFEREQDVDIVYGDAVFIDAHGRPQFVRKRRFWRYPLFLRGWTIPQPAIFVRRSVLERHSLDESLEYAMDQEFWLRIFDEHRSRYLDDIVAVDRLHEAAKRVAADPAEYRAELESVLARHGQTFAADYRLRQGTDLAYLATMRLWGVLDALRVDDSEEVMLEMDWQSKRNLLPL